MTWREEYSNYKTCNLFHYDFLRTCEAIEGYDMDIDTDTARHTCLKIQLEEGGSIYVKGTWFDSHFELSITNGQEAWICHRNSY